jgi:cytochrome b561
VSPVQRPADAGEGWAGIVSFANMLSGTLPIDKTSLTWLCEWHVTVGAAILMLTLLIAVRHLLSSARPRDGTLSKRIRMG